MKKLCYMFLMVCILGFGAGCEQQLMTAELQESITRAFFGG